MGEYDGILAKQGDIQYKVLMARIADANENHEENRLKRIELALKIICLPTSDKHMIEAAIGEDLDLEDRTSD